MWVAVLVVLGVVGLLLVEGHMRSRRINRDLDARLESQSRSGAL